MKRSIPSAVDVYEKTFDALISFIEETQTIEFASTYFEFLTRTIQYDASSVRMAIIQEEFPFLYTRLKSYEDNLKQFHVQLKDLYDSVKPKRRKSIASSLLKRLERLDANLGAEKVKRRIKSSITDENMYYLDHTIFSFPIRTAKPHVWVDFHPSHLDTSYLFEDYHDLLLNLFYFLDSEVMYLEEGFKVDHPIKYDNLLAKPSLLDIRQVIREEKYESFINWCKYFSKERVYSSMGSIKFIDKRDNDFYWEAFSRARSGAFPQLAAFANRLLTKSYMRGRPSNKQISKTFLNYFTGSNEYAGQAKDMSKYFRAKTNKWHPCFEEIK